MNRHLRALFRPEGASSHMIAGYHLRGESTDATLLLPLPGADVAEVADALNQSPRTGARSVPGILQVFISVASALGTLRAPESKARNHHHQAPRSIRAL